MERVSVRCITAAGVVSALLCLGAPRVGAALFRRSCPADTAAAGVVSALLAMLSASSYKVRYPAQHTYRISACQTA